MNRVIRATKGKRDAVVQEADDTRMLSQMSDDCYWMNTDLHRLGRQRGY